MASSDKFVALASVLMEYPIVASEESTAGDVAFCCAPFRRVKVFVDSPSSPSVGESL